MAALKNIGLVTAPGGLFATRLVTESGGLATNPPVTSLLETTVLYTGQRQGFVTEGPLQRYVQPGGAGAGTATNPYFESQPQSEQQEKLDHKRVREREREPEREREGNCVRIDTCPRNAKGPKARIVANSCLFWGAVKQLKLSFHNPKTTLFTMYQYYGNLK